MENKFYRVGDDVIAQVARILQLSLLTGTDVVDHMRNLKLEEHEDGVLGLTDEYIKYEKVMIESLMDDLSKNLDKEASN